MFDRVDALAATAQAGGAGGRTTYQAFKAADDAWYQLRHMKVCIVVTTWDVQGQEKGRFSV